MHHAEFWALMPVYESHTNGVEAANEIIRLFMLMNPKRNRMRHPYEPTNYVYNMTDAHRKHYQFWFKVCSQLYIKNGFH
jgi:hypothetical protein